MENELKNNIDKEINIELNTNIGTNQQNFIGKMLGGAINTAIDTAIRILLPDALEEEIINVKNIVLNDGLKEGIKSITEAAVSLGKSAIGIVTGNFENVSQVYNAVKSGGVIDSVSKVVDQALKSANKNGLIKEGTAKVLKKGKNVIKECVSSNIEKTFMEQVDSIEKIGKYINNWDKYLESKDFNGMQKEYKKIEEKMENILPLETTLKQIKGIKNIQTLIKHKGGIENLTKEEIEVAKKLV